MIAPKFKHYKQYKQHLREEFQYQCVYCRIRESEMGGASNFSVDHYRPKKKFPSLQLSYENLLYACNYCNRFKSDYWPKLLEEIQKKIILNPREDKITEHLNIELPCWKGKTPRGMWNIEKLRLSSPRNIQIRENRDNILGAINNLEFQKNRLHTEDFDSLKKREEIVKQIHALKSIIAGQLD